MYVDFIVSRPLDAFLFVNVGPGGIIGGAIGVTIMNALSVRGLIPRIGLKNEQRS